MGGLFVFDVVLMFVLGFFLKCEFYVENIVNKGDVDLINWKYIKVIFILLIFGLFVFYVFLLLIGLVLEVGNLSMVLGVYVVL